MNCAYLAFTAKGLALAQQLAQTCPGTVSRCGLGGVTLAGWTAQQFAAADALVFVGAAGIAVRAIAPHCQSKATDPAVVVLDECGRFAVPLLSGHLGGANDLACRLAAACGAVPVITTATDANGLFAVDEWAKKQNCAVWETPRIKFVSGALLAGKTVLVIAHRMRTVAGADKIVVLSDGVVAEQGAPDALYARNGQYTHMVDLQTESQSWAI